MILKRAKLFDGKTLHPEPMDLEIREGRITALAPDLPVKDRDRVIRLSGKIVAPGFIDLHGHFRDPGQTWREDLISGSRAAAAGGYTLAVAMPNTNPPLDSPALIRYVKQRGANPEGARILPAGCVSKGRAGQKMAELGGMAQEGAVLFTDDGSPVARANLLRQALLYSLDLGVRIMEHPEETSLTSGAQVHEGRCSAVSGMTGFPEAAEVIGVSRGIALARETGCPIHLTHLSTAGALKEVRRAKADGLAVTCDVTPHHLTLSEEDVLSSGLSGVFKVNPPLRSLADVEALWEGLWDGTVDAIATDHAPYHQDEKDLPFQEAAFGIASYECAAALVLDRWEADSRPGPLERILAAFTSGPARVLPASLGPLGLIEEGLPADLTVLDLDRIVEVNPSSWQSKASLSPVAGRNLRGGPILTMVNGRVVFSALEGAEPDA